MSQVIGRNGSVTLTLLAGQSIAVGSYGPGNTRIYSAGFISNQLNPIMQLQASVANGALYLTYAAATVVTIEASNGNEVEYDFGAQPSLVNSPFAVATGLTAKAGGGQSLATPLTGNINKVTVCATAADSALLPAATAGKRVSVFNGGAAACAVFPQTGESINNTAVNTAFSVATLKGAIFECVATGLWNVILSA